MDNNNYKITIEQRITRLETKLDDLIDNHIHGMNKKLNWILVSFVAILVGVIVNLIR